jgi:hypothetical protein
MTNSLCVHYVAYHRHEVPEAELEKSRQLTAKSAEPTSQELHGDGPIFQRSADGQFLEIPAPINRLREQYEARHGK